MPKVYEETRYWCEYCRIFVYNNHINREKHDNSPQHQANFKKRVDAIRREEKEREKLFPKPIVPSAKQASFYTASSAAKQQQSSAPPTNLLNVKTAVVAPKKQILGLAPNSSQQAVKPTSTESVQSSSTDDPSLFSGDIKASSNDLKRKIAEDELALHSFTIEKEQETSSTLPVEEVDISSMFKKKRSNNK